MQTQLLRRQISKNTEALHNEERDEVAHAAKQDAAAQDFVLKAEHARAEVQELRRGQLTGEVDGAAVLSAEQNAYLLSETGRHADEFVKCASQWKRRTRLVSGRSSPRNSFELSSPPPSSPRPASEGDESSVREDFEGDRDLLQEDDESRWRHDQRDHVIKVHVMGPSVLLQNLSDAGLRTFDSSRPLELILSPMSNLTMSPERV